VKLSTSNKGIEFLIKKEGCILKVYRDSAGHPTIGIGHLITQQEKNTGSIYNVNYKNGITKDQAIYIKRQDLNKFENYINSYVNSNINLTQNEFDGLVSLCFNIGPNAFKNSTLLRRLNSDHTRTLVADQFLVWKKAGGKVIRGLVTRRTEEREIFLNNKY